MSKSLIIVRHAKSDWVRDLPDHHRPLNARGLFDAELMAAYLATKNLHIDHVYCSDALRTQQTLEVLARHVRPSKISLMPELYLAEVSALCAVIENIPASCQTAMLLGHNPGLTELCNGLTGDDMANLPTCGVYEVRLLVDDWRAIAPNMGECVLFKTPRMLKDTE